MSEINSKERAEQYVFAYNAKQSKVFNTFNLYSIAIVGLVIAAIEYVVGRSDGELISEILAFVQAAFALSGLLFAFWISQMKKDAVKNTYFSQACLLFEITGLVIGLCMLAAHLLSPKMPAAAYIIPWAIYALSFFIIYAIIHARSAVHEYKSSRTWSFGTFIVVLIIAIVVGRGVGSGAFGLISSMGDSSQGLAAILVGVLMAFILGSLTAINFYKNLLVKKFDIDLSRLYEDDGTQL
ncbi:MAG: hypothetical protein LBO70_01290 [Clostridiales Family XIII bacterium]|jgi:hypothetical protein|nr:hypothetical protein [Clostridiales Family XIII bacterium]